MQTFQNRYRKVWALAKLRLRLTFLAYLSFRLVFFVAALFALSCSKSSSFKGNSGQGIAKTDKGTRSDEAVLGKNEPIIREQGAQPTSTPDPVSSVTAGPTPTVVVPQEPAYCDGFDLLRRFEGQRACFAGGTTDLANKAPSLKFEEIGNYLAGGRLAFQVKDGRDNSFIDWWGIVNAGADIMSASTEIYQGSFIRTNEYRGCVKKIPPGNYELVIFYQLGNSTCKDSARLAFTVPNPM